MAQKPIQDGFTAASETASHSRSHGHPPLNQGIRYADVDRVQAIGAVHGNFMEASALVKLRSCDPKESASIFSRFNPLPDCCWYSMGSFT